MKTSLPPGAPRVIDCRTCTGYGVARIAVVQPDGSRGRARHSVCPDCRGTGARIRKAVAA